MDIDVSPREIFSGEKSVDCAFIFEDSPQGLDFWLDKKAGDVEFYDALCKLYVDFYDKPFTMEDVEYMVLAWATARNIFDEGTVDGQLVKLQEELDELKDACENEDRGGIKDAIGDCMVVLAIIAKMKDLDLRYCFESAFREIQPRRGRMKDGVFVKEEKWRPAAFPQDWGKEAMFWDSKKANLLLDELCGKTKDEYYTWLDSNGTGWQNCEVKE